MKHALTFALFRRQTSTQHKEKKGKSDGLRSVHSMPDIEKSPRANTQTSPTIKDKLRVNYAGVSLANMLRILALLSIVLFYFEVSKHNKHGLIADQDQTPLSSDDAGTTANGESNENKSPSAGCKVGEVYGSCFNEIRYYQCTADGPVPYPCPIGQEFHCTENGSGQCDTRGSILGKNNCEMKCDKDGKEELGRCVCH